MTVLGNLAIDHVDDDPASPGGCPSFAGLALESSPLRKRIITRAAAHDLGLFSDFLASSPVPVDLLPAECTSAFGLRYHGDDRELTVDGIGPTWGVEDIRSAQLDTTWVHLSPLLRTDFPAETLAFLVTAGHSISYDGQGLVRVPRLGPLLLDADFDSSIFRHLTVLKVAGEEAEVIVGRSFDSDAAVSLGVPEILVTHGQRGCDVYVDGSPTFVPSPFRVEGVHTTGAGDMFGMSYVAARAEGLAPVDAAGQAAALVALRLQARRVLAISPDPA